MEQDIVLAMNSISKSFPGVQALDNVTFQVTKGEIHALVGENGAGKSTLMNILDGAILKDKGEIIFHEKRVEIDSPRKAQSIGISMIHQELALIPYLNIGQNIYLGREPLKGLGLFVDWKKLYILAKNELSKLDMNIDPRTLVVDISIAHQQMIEVAKALSLNASIIIMDEPTSSLTEKETEILFKVMRSLKNQGITIIYISHRLDEVFDIADRITVLRDGQHVGTSFIQQIKPYEVIHKMVGRELGDMYPKKAITSNELVLKINNLCSGKKLHNISFELHKGEILGIAGLIGAGRTELARSIFGIDPINQGDIIVEGKKVFINSPKKAISLGLGFVPEDRKKQGLFLDMAVRGNITIGKLKALSILGFLRFRQLAFLAENFVKQLNIRTPSLGQRVQNLSGGNQQKVIIARWLTLNPKIFILDDPTRGIDVGTKAEIYALIDQLAEKGVGIIMISSELNEILGISDRILVMREGHIVGDFSRQEANQNAIMHCAASGGSG